MRLVVAIVSIRRAIDRYPALRAEADKALEVEASCSVHEPDVFHVLCIPNYKEPENLLAATLAALAEHTLAKREYVICLAMEAGEDGSDTKAERLISKFGARFAAMCYTRHVAQPNEMRGKLSNVDWCFSHAKEELDILELPANKCLMTTLDADAIIPELYFLEISRLWREYQDGTPFGERVPRERLIFGAPGLFERNCLEVPFFTRVMDAVWSVLALQQMASAFNIAFPLSNYTLSLELLQETNFLDAHPDAIADDSHVVLKAYFKTRGNIRFHAVWAPINMLNLNEGAWFKTLWERFIQAKRHFRGQHDFSYALRQTFVLCAAPRPLTALVLIKCVETHLFPVLGPLFMMGALPFIQLLDWIKPNSSELWGNHDWMRPWFVILFGLSLLGAYVAMISGFEYVRRLVNRRLYNKPSPPLWHLIEYVAIIPDTFAYIIIPHMITSTLSLMPCISQGGYKVATKVMADGDDDAAAQDLSSSAQELVKDQDRTNAKKADVVADADIDDNLEKP
eukprot:CAMPEP_0185851932 /NCGR_PEP_ID=MMETSP1354-20130828/12444_1 /TAXON_ID=708628 /ORGANISM="Erythrolobus madagascarensis, Strain CCMP3276" /LENGTH=510 /DNA_ID=CAMNT_0028553047 /DNA_START=143 /DNA_END=1675 /DNA_ORIENTATION=-